MPETRKLSELIREGAKLRPKATGVYFNYNADNQLCSCAFGAAYEGAGGKLTPSIVKTMALKGNYEPGGKQIRRLLEKVLGYNIETSPEIIEHPDYPGGLALFDLVAMRWNDGRGLTREEIADKLEEIGL